MVLAETLGCEIAVAGFQSSKVCDRNLDRKNMAIHLKPGPRWLRCGLSYLLIFTWTIPYIRAQESPPEQLSIIVVDGEGAINHVRQRASRDPVVRIEDERNRPIAGATVVFTLPADGTSGEFNGSKTSTLVTDNQGQATARGLKVNQTPGKLQIHVNASYRGVRSRTTITQFNMQVPGVKSGGSGKIIAILAIVGGAAAGGAIAASRKGGTAAGGTPVTPAAAIGITPGTSTVGPPR